LGGADVKSSDACSASPALSSAAYLNHFSAEPLIAPIAWLAEQDVRDVFDAVVPVDQLPYASAGLALIAQDQTDAADVIPLAGKSGTRDRLWQAARANLADPRQATDRVAAAILATIG
jgi:hypothetical protein